MILNIMIPTINRADLLIQSLQTLEVQSQFINKMLIIDNGKQESLKMILTDQIYRPDKNLGFAGSCNYAIEYFKNTPYDWLLILNDDIVLNEMQLQDIHAVLESAINKYFLMVGPYYFSMFALNRKYINQYLEKGKLFDEKFYPAYFEDNDLTYRILLQDPSKVRFNVGTLCPALCRNSQSIEKDPKLNANFYKNKEYYIEKWGGLPGGERYKVAFIQPLFEV